MRGLTSKNRSAARIRSASGWISSSRISSFWVGWFWIGAVVLAACSSPPEPIPPLQARLVVELNRWEARSDQQLLGHLVELEIQDPAGPVRFYQIEDAAGRIVGSATANRRFSRRVPFQDEERDVGVWSLQSGVARLFDLPADQQVDLTVVALDADARKR